MTNVKGGAPEKVKDLCVKHNTPVYSLKKRTIITP